MKTLDDVHNVVGTHVEGVLVIRRGVDEVIYVIAGRMTVKEDGHEPIDIKPGDFVILPVGWQGFWEVTESLKKVYVIVE